MHPAFTSTLVEDRLRARRSEAAAARLGAAALASRRARWRRFLGERLIHAGVRLASPTYL